MSMFSSRWKQWIVTLIIQYTVFVLAFKYFPEFFWSFCLDNSHTRKVSFPLQATHWLFFLHVWADHYGGKNLLGRCKKYWLVFNKRKFEHIIPSILIEWSALAPHQTMHCQVKILLTTYKALNGLAPGHITNLIDRYVPMRSVQSSNQLLLIMESSMCRHRFIWRQCIQHWSAKTKEICSVWNKICWKLKPIII